LGLYYYGARYYDAELGRFITVDPARGKYPGLSPYIYCANNPLKYVDPDGRAATSAISAGALFVLGAATIAYIQYQTNPEVRKAHDHVSSYVGKKVSEAIDEVVNFVKGRRKGQPQSIGNLRPIRDKTKSTASSRSGPPTPDKAPDEPEPKSKEPFPEGELRGPTGSPTGSDKPPMPTDPNLVPQPPTIGSAAAVSVPEDKNGSKEVDEKEDTD